MVDLLLIIIIIIIRNHRGQAADLHLRGRPKHCMLTPAFPNVFVLRTYPRTEVVEHAHMLSSLTPIEAYTCQRKSCVSVRYDI